MYLNCELSCSHECGNGKAKESPIRPVKCQKNNVKRDKNKGKEVREKGEGTNRKIIKMTLT